MKSQYFIRLVGFLTALVILIALPFYADIAHPGLYYLITVLAAVCGFVRFIQSELFDKRFYTRWRKARNRGIGRNAVWNGSLSFLIMVTGVMISQYVGNDHTPRQIISALANHMSLLTGILIFLVLLSIICGIISWYENEKRYSRISHYMHDKI